MFLIGKGFLYTISLHTFPFMSQLGLHSQMPPRWGYYILTGICWLKKCSLAFAKFEMLNPLE